MKYDITVKNLQFAYLKFKHYVYHDSSYNYMKKELLEFEKNWSDDDSFDDYFKKLFNELCKLEKKNKNERMAGEISSIVIPKKDKAKDRVDGKIEVEEVNIFIKMPIIYYLIDILFSLNILYKKSNIFLNNLSFGSKVNDVLIESENFLENCFLFENHTSTYSKWKNKPYVAFKEMNSEKAILLKLDLRRCFYNFNFDIKQFIKDIFDEDDFLLEIEMEIYNFYTFTIYDKFMKKNKERNISMLPIGLISSSIILNYYLSFFDEEISKRCVSYGRYIDDILILFEYKKEYLCKKLDSLLPAVFSEKYTNNKEGYFLIIETNNGNTITLPINKEKIKVKICNKGETNKFKKDCRDLFSASFYEEIDDNRESIIENDAQKLSSIRKELYRLDISNEQKKNYIDNLSNADLINSYSLWDLMYNICKEEKVFFNRVNNAIESIFIPENYLFKNIKEKLSSSLKTEWEVAKSLTDQKEYYYKKYLYGVDQNAIFDYINNFKDSRYKCYPLEITKTQISLYIQFYQKLENNFEDIICNKYYELNNVFCNQTDIYDIKKKKLTVVSYKKDKEENQNKVKVAVVNLMIPVSRDNEEIEKYDIDHIYPKNLSFNDICYLIDCAKKDGADYIVFPEFAIQMDRTLDIVNFGIKKKISIVAGLTHFVFNNNKYATNCTLIYSDPIHKPFIHKKRYMAPEERELLEKNKIIGLDSIDPYIVINDKKMTYSVLTCYEATNIRERSWFNNIVDSIFMPVFNKDTEYFSSIVTSFSRDINSYVIQSNVNGYGDSRITAPYGSFYKDLVKLKGGINHFYVIGEIDFTLRDKVRELEKKLSKYQTYINNPDYFDEINRLREEIKQEIKKFKEDNNLPKDLKWKPLSAGNYKITNE